MCAVVAARHTHRTRARLAAHGLQSTSGTRPLPSCVRPRSPLLPHRARNEAAITRAHTHTACARLACVACQAGKTRESSLNAPTDGRRQHRYGWHRRLRPGLASSGAHGQMWPIQHAAVMVAGLPPLSCRSSNTHTHTREKCAASARTHGACLCNGLLDVVDDVVEFLVTLALAVAHGELGVNELPADRDLEGTRFASFVHLSLDVDLGAKLVGEKG